MALQALRQQYTDIPKLVGLLTRLFGKGNFRVDVREKKISSLPPPPPSRESGQTEPSLFETRTKKSALANDVNWGHDS
jgi:hypothetical protein